MTIPVVKLHFYKSVCGAADPIRGRIYCKARVMHKDILLVPVLLTIYQVNENIADKYKLLNRPKRGKNIPIRSC